MHVKRNAFSKHGVKIERGANPFGCLHAVACRHHDWRPRGARRLSPRSFVRRASSAKISTAITHLFLECFLPRASFREPSKIVSLDEALQTNQSRQA